MYCMVKYLYFKKKNLTIFKKLNVDFRKTLCAKCSF